MNSPNLLKNQMERVGGFIDESESELPRDSDSETSRKSIFEKLNPPDGKRMATVLFSLAQELGNLEDELHRSQMSLSEVQRQASELSQKLAENQKLLRSTTEERDKYCADLSKKSELCKELQGQQSNLTERAQAFQERYEKLKNTHRSLVLRLQQRDQEIAQIQKTLSRLKVRVEEKISNLKDEHQKALKILDQQSQEKLAIQKRHYEKELAVLQSKVEEGAKVEKKTRLEKEQILMRSRDLAKQLEGLGEQKRRLRRELDESQATIERNCIELERSIQQVEKFWKEEIEKRQQDWLEQKSILIEKVKSHERQLQERDRKKIGETRFFREKLVQVQAEKKSLERRISKMGLELEKARLQIDKGRKLAPEVIDESRALKGRLNLLETEFRLRQESERKLKEENEKARGDLQALRTTSEAYKDEIERLKQENMRVSQDLTRESEEKKSLRRRILEQKDELEKSFEESRQRLKESLKSLQAKVDEKDNRIGELEASLEQKIMEINRENEGKMEEIESAKKEIEKGLMELEQKKKAFAEKDLRLRSYCKSLDQQKTELKKQYLVLHSEIQNLRAMNPLREYLVVTDREVSRLQILLAKTPQFSEERGRLEDEVSRLIKQRDSLRDMVTSADREMERRALRLMTLVQSEELVDCPPLPPEP